MAPCPFFLTIKFKDMKDMIFRITVALMMICLPMTIFAQAGGPPATPIDGGLSLLLAAGGAYGIRQIAKSRKK
jgi:hypothetical protein